MAAQNNKQISQQEWINRINEINISKDQMNKLILNYFVVEGYEDAAHKFINETASSQDQNDGFFLIKQRKFIRQLIQDDRIDEAIDQINDLNPDILENRADLHFELMKQKLLGMIKADKIEEAIFFAQEKLAPKAENNPELLKEIEKVMGLLAFENPSNSPDSEILEYSVRHQLASKINSAILQSLCKPHQKKLPTLLKMLLWSQQRTNDLVKIPKILDIASGKLE